MSFPHHGDEAHPMSQELRKLFQSQQSELVKRFESERAGTAKREFPEGRLGAGDDGSLTFKIGADVSRGVVAIEYSKPTAWVAMNPQQAVELAQALIKHARSIAKEPLRLVVN